MTEDDDPRRDVGTEGDGGTRTFHWHAGGRGSGPAQTVIEGVATVTDTDPKRLRPLYEVVDPEGLDALFSPTDEGERESSNGRVTFRFEGCTVCVHADGRVTVTPEADGDG